MAEQEKQKKKKRRKKKKSNDEPKGKRGKTLRASIEPSAVDFR